MDRRVDFAIGTLTAIFGIAVVLIGEATIRPGLGGDVLGPRAFPRMVGIGLTLGGLAIALLALRALRRGEAHAVGGGAGDEPEYPASSGRAFTVMGLTIAYSVLMTPLGFVVATPLYFGALLRVLNVRSVAVYLGMCVGFTIVVYTIFAYVLRVPLTSGLLHPIFQAVGLER